MNMLLRDLAAAPDSEILSPVDRPPMRSIGRVELTTVETDPPSVAQFTIHWGGPALFVAWIVYILVAHLPL